MNTILDFAFKVKCGDWILDKYGSWWIVKEEINNLTNRIRCGTFSVGSVIEEKNILVYDIIRVLILDAIRNGNGNENVKQSFSDSSRSSPTSD